MAPLTARRWLVGALLADAALRLRFLNVPITVDEAGYGQVARLWSRGFALYGDVAWVDRPQGLVGLYRLAVGVGDDWAIRSLALLAGLVLVLAVASIAWTLAGARVAVLAAWLIALLGPAPHLEGFTANGELLGGAVAAAAIAVGLRWRTQRRPSLLLTAGALAGLAPLLKQSAFDGAIVVLVLIVLVTAQDRRLGAAALRLALLAAGIAIPWLAAASSAAASPPGISGWWFAIYGYRAETESLVSGDLGFRLHLLASSVPPMLVDGAPLLVLGLLGVLALRRQRALRVPLAWLGACALGFLVGGLYHPHYWVQLLPPLALLAGVGADALLSTLPRRRAAMIIGVLVGIPLLAATPVYFAATPELASERSSNDPRIISAVPVGAAVAAATGPNDRVQVLWANAAVYWHADRIPATRYLWYRNIERIPGGREAVAASLTGDAPPALAVGYQPVDALDVDGTIQAALATRYTRTTVAGVPIWTLHP